METIREILNEINFSPSFLELQNYIFVYYWDNVKKELKKINFHSTNFTEDNFSFRIWDEIRIVNIPFHRIMRITCEVTGENGYYNVIWERTKKLKLLQNGKN